MVFLDHFRFGIFQKGNQMQAHWVGRLFRYIGNRVDERLPRQTRVFGPTDKHHLSDSAYESPVSQMGTGF